MAEAKAVLKTQFVTKMASLLTQCVDIGTRNRNCVSLLHLALREQVECVVDTLLQERVSVLEKDDEGFSALYHAFQSKSVRMMDKVLQKGAPIDELQESGKTVLHLALQNKMENIVEFLLLKGASVTLKDVVYGNCALYYAICSGEVTLVGKVIERGAKLNGEFQGKKKSPVHLAVDINSTEILRLLLEKGSDPNRLDNCQYTPLQYAVLSDRIDVAKILLLHGATIETKRGESILFCPKLSAGMVSLLLQNGAQADAVDRLGQTPLIVASAHGLKEVVKVLLDQGTDVDRSDARGRSALHHAATEAVAELLTHKGANVDAADAEGNTPLLLSALQERWSTAEALLLAGSHVELKNKNGQNFIHLYHKLDPSDVYFRIVTEYIIKLKLANLEENLTGKFLYDVRQFRDFEAVCSSELSRLKVAKLYDVLVDKNKDGSVLKNKLLVMKIKNPALESEYPIYCNLLRRNLRKTVRRNKFVTVAKLSTTVTVGQKSVTLPDYISNKLIDIIPEHVIDSLI